MSSRISRLYQFCFSLSGRRVGARFCRVLYGAWLLTFFLQGLPDSRFLWSDAGLVSQDLYLQRLETSREFSIFVFGRSPGIVQLAAVLGALLSALAVIGLYPRLMLGLLIPLVWSFHSVNPFILDGGDNLGRIVIFVMPLLILNHREANEVGSGTWWALAHNLARFAVALQLASLYFSSVWDKLAGKTWQNGTAMYYVFQSDQFSAPWVPSYFKSNAIVICLVTTSVVLSQISFPLLFPYRKPRNVVCLALIAMHFGIALYMGLFRFSLVMVAMLALLISDDAYALLREWCVVSWRRMSRWRAARLVPLETGGTD